MALFKNLVRSIVASKSAVYSTDFIVEYLQRIERPATTGEIKDALGEANIKITSSSVNWTLTKLNAAKRIQRVGRGVYAAVRNDFLKPSSEPSSITDGIVFRRWLEQHPLEFGQVIATRIGLRCLPLTDVILFDSASAINSDAILALFRSAFLSWVSNISPSREFARLTENAAIAAAKHARKHSDRALNAMAQGAYASPSASKAIDGATAAADFSFAVVEPSHMAEMWASIDADARWLSQTSRVEPISRAVAQLAQQPLWLHDAQGNLGIAANVPKWISAFWDAFKKVSDLEEVGFDIWVNWYDLRLKGGDSSFGEIEYSEEAENNRVWVALQAGNFWERDATIVNNEIREKLAEERNGSGSPLEPVPGPGPQYRPRGGKLSEDVSPPNSSEAERQAALHRHLRAEASKLAVSLQRAANRHPELAGAAKEYAELLQNHIAEVDVPGVWSVGGALATFARSYREQNVARTLSEPLEPQLDAALQSVVRQHGAFIMGFDEGRDLVQRADAFAVDIARLREIEAPGATLLTELTENAELVDDRTRELHRPIRDSVTEFGWSSSRAGYSAYLIIRNSVRAMIKFTVGENRSFGEVISIAAGLSVFAGDPNVEFIRAAIPVLKQHGSQLLAFFDHSPEMRAYVEWALHLLKADKEEDNPP